MVKPLRTLDGSNLKPVLYYEFAMLRPNAASRPAYD